MKVRFLFTGHYNLDFQQKRNHIKNSLQQVDGCLHQVYNLHRQFVETSHPLSSLQTFELEPRNSLVCPHCTAACHTKSFCLHGPRRQPPCEPVWGFALCSYQQRGQVFLSSKVFCSNDQLFPQSIELFKIFLPLWDFVPVGTLCCHLSWKHWLLHPSNWNQPWTKKNCANLSEQLPKST